MSTRSAIARQTEAGFTGVYHHWDGYPDGVGATLLEIYQGHFNRDLAAMLRYLIDEHQAGWSTINGADWSLPAGPRHDFNDAPCAECGLPSWQHYAQNYRHNEARKPLLDAILQAMEPAKAQTIREGRTFALFNHAFREAELPHGPECHVGTPNIMDETNAQACGCEYAYVFDEPNHVMRVLSSYNRHGRKMIGMFGFGDPESCWREIGRVELDGPNAAEQLAEASRTAEAA